MYEDLFSLKGRVALVTGGSRGIGRMIAEGYLAAGVSRVYITARKAGPCEATAKELTAKFGGECIALPIDISTVAGCQMLDGVLRADARYRVFRKKEKVWDGKLTSLKHFQNEVSEVSGSQECGIFFNGFEEFQVGDTIECYALEELPRTL